MIAAATKRKRRSVNGTIKYYSRSIRCCNVTAIIVIFCLMISSNTIIVFLNAWTVHSSSISSLIRIQADHLASSRLYQLSSTSSLVDLEKNATTPVSSSQSTQILLNSSIFGPIYRIRVPGEEENEDDLSFLGAMGVPTFAATKNQNTKQNYILDSTVTTRIRGLEGVLDHGPAFIVDNVLSQDVCEQIISDCENLKFGNFNCGRNHHGAMQIVVNQNLTNIISQRIAPHINIHEVEKLRQETIQATYNHENKNQIIGEDVRLFFVGLNRRWRIYRYDSSGNEIFAPHIDAGFPPSGLTDEGTSLLWDASIEYSHDKEVVSRLTILMYLNDDFVGGETNFYRPASKQKDYTSAEQSQPLIASVKPKTGSVLFFPQGVGEEAVEYARQFWPLHEGSQVFSGRPKYVIRSDAIFVTQKEKLLLNDELFQYDHLVRQAFLSKSHVWKSEFLSHAASLYNPHMGVENLGPFLYSFLRMTKLRQIVEIGAGFTSIWILQALKDNDDELQEISTLEETGQCKLLDIDWTVPSTLKNLAEHPARLLCVDNCEHQKETATGASAVAKSLGLDGYLEFQRGDAFDLDLGTESVDALWCDFGVGNRMKDFMSSAWHCIRPGGFLLCHSTLTNENTREWLEAMRSRQAQEVTGIATEEYVEVSLLEPHKRYQNSISIIQKRKSMTGETFQEPVYSQYS